MGENPDSGGLTKILNHILGKVKSIVHTPCPLGHVSWSARCDVGDLGVGVVAAPSAPRSEGMLRDGVGPGRIATRDKKKVAPDPQRGGAAVRRAALSRLAAAPATQKAPPAARRRAAAAMAAPWPAAQIHPPLRANNGTLPNTISQHNSRRACTTYSLFLGISTILIFWLIPHLFVCPPSVFVHFPVTERWEWGEFAN
eukprot:gene9703-biopygen21257